MSLAHGAPFGSKLAGRRCVCSWASSRAPIAVKFFGDDLVALRASAATVALVLGPVPGVRSVRAPGLVEAPTIDLEKV